MKGFVKDPDATLDYGVDWTLWLGADTISTSTWVLESGISAVPASETSDGKKTSIFITGGSPGETYLVTNRIVTDGQRTEERSFELKIRER